MIPGLGSLTGGGGFSGSSAATASGGSGTGAFNFGTSSKATPWLVGGAIVAAVVVAWMWKRK